MTSWYSNILTKTTSQISSLRSTLLSSENDGDTDDDTHVCRVLRNYYTDKGRPLPNWLPPDPKAPAPVPQALYAPSSQVGARYGGLNTHQGGSGAAAAAGGGGLSSLWDSAPQQGGAPPPSVQSQGLRTRPGGMPSRGAGAGAGLMPGREEIQARPLPSQRAGSYQNAMPHSGAGGGGAGAGAGAAGGASAQDRLKQRLWGAARQPSPSQAGSQFQPPGGGGGGGPGGASYEDRFAPGGPYGPPGGAGGGGGGGQRRPGLPSGPRGYR
ncbi:hypothetical protein QQS21_003091 [Conoideocrella luteorostrata]|uniref:Mso1 N-terminal domain-containing protein n=1 Tax=Conoideocrella luteorostrata TaxID=1105319 RepID=A0AAJ0G0S3_9HYPO|nr:hypothetical protein QQS21_003091 [Conoideocrella luteorostrata]